MHVITVYGWEDRAATRIQIGCEDVARDAKAAAEALGYETDIMSGININRSDDEKLRANRLIDKIVPIMNGES